MAETEKKWWSSSQNPAQISLTLKALVPLVLGLAPFFGFDVTEGELDQVIGAIVSCVAAVGVLWGFVRKFK